MPTLNANGIFHIIDTTTQRVVTDGSKYPLEHYNKEKAQIEAQRISKRKRRHHAVIEVSK